MWRNKVGLGAAAIVLALITTMAVAAVKPDTKARVPVLSVTGDLAGGLAVVASRYEDTFAAIGNTHSLGFLELVKANPGVDPWLPGEGTTITLPRHYVLPEAKRKGIVINLAEYRLYYFTDKGVSVYPVGVGTEDNPSPVTDASVTMTLESPAWYPPKSILAKAKKDGEYLPRMIPPGPDNPLGPYAIMLSEPGYLIHGTNKQFGVGTQVSHGCFRMYNEDISRFVYEVAKGASVQVVNQPVKVGMNGSEVWLEVHRSGEEYPEADREALWKTVSTRLETLRQNVPGLELQRGAIESAVDQADGIPRMIGEQLTQVAAEQTTSTGNKVPADGDNNDSSALRLWF